MHFVDVIKDRGLAHWYPLSDAFEALQEQLGYASELAAVTWRATKMRLGLLPPMSVAVGLGAAMTAAQCPDYTTYSQVRDFKKAVFTFVSLGFLDGARKSVIRAVGVTVHETDACMPHVQQHCCRSQCKASKYSWYFNVDQRTQEVIGNMTSRMKDPDLARLFENTFPNTLGRLSSELWSY